MPSRMIRQGILGSKRVAKLKFRDRWLYVGILLHADDFGLFEADSELLRGAVFARDLGTISERDCESGLVSIQQAELVKFYVVNGKRYGALWNFGQKLKRRRALHPMPPPEIVDWMTAGEDAAPREPEPNRTEPEQEGETNPSRVPLAALAGYALQRCLFKLGTDGAAKVLRAVGGEHDRHVVSALEHLASRDERTRWQDISNPLGLIIKLSQSFRDGIGPHPEGDFEPFETWLAGIKAGAARMP